MFKDSQSDHSVILLCVRWYSHMPLSSNLRRIPQGTFFGAGGVPWVWNVSIVFRPHA
jgi:hypothetical protein